jgi:hypothetical protein
MYQMTFVQKRINEYLNTKLRAQKPSIESNGRC